MIAPSTPSDAAFDTLHAAGWSIGDTATESGWVVSGQRGEEEIMASGRTKSEAWAAAVEQAEAMPAIILKPL
jgi:hypothetical protein